MSNDLEELTKLNKDYVDSVQNCDVKRFDEILAQDFYCTNPDKSLVDRAAFPHRRGDGAGEAEAVGIDGHGEASFRARDREVWVSGRLSRHAARGDGDCAPQPSLSPPAESPATIWRWPACSSPR